MGLIGLAIWAAVGEQHNAVSAMFEELALCSGCGQLFYRKGWETNYRTWTYMGCPRCEGSSSMGVHQAHQQADAYFHEGFEALRAGQVDQMLIRAKWCFCLGRQAHFDRMVSAAREAHPNNAEVAKVLGWSRLVCRSPSQAEPWLARAVELAPADAEARLFHGQALGELEQWPEAVQQLQTGIALAPNDFRARLALLDLLQRTQMWREALLQAEDLLQHSPCWEDHDGFAAQLKKIRKQVRKLQKRDPLGEQGYLSNNLAEPPSYPTNGPTC